MSKKKPRKRATAGNGAPKKKSGETVKKTDEVFVRAIRLEREFPPDQLAFHANQFAVQHDGSEVYLMFFQAHPPLILGDSPAEIKRQIDKVRAVKARCVARIVMSAERLPAVIEALQENLEKQKKAIEAKNVTGN